MKAYKILKPENPYAAYAILFIIFITEIKNINA